MLIELLTYGLKPVPFKKARTLQESPYPSRRPVPFKKARTLQEGPYLSRKTSAESVWMKVWRICRERYAAAALTGEGARLAGGRWNSVDVSMVYTSWCLSLAALEVFVNLDPGNQPRDLVWLAVEAPVEQEWERRGEKDFLSSLPRHWREHDDPETQRFGDDWIRSGRSAGLVVPSVLIEGEWNVLLNPGHPDAGKIKVVETRPFGFDERMFRE